MAANATTKKAHIFSQQQLCARNEQLEKQRKKAHIMRERKKGNNILISYAVQTITDCKATSSRVALSLRSHQCPGGRSLFFIPPVHWNAFSEDALFTVREFVELVCYLH